MVIKILNSTLNNDKQIVEQSKVKKALQNFGDVCRTISNTNKTDLFSFYIVCNYTFPQFPALFAVIGMIIYAVLLPTDFYTSYSLGLITLAAGLFATAGCLLIPDVRNNIYKTTKTRVTPPPPSPSLPPIESPPPRYREHTPEYYTPSPRPQKKRGYWEYKEYETPRPTERRTPRDVVRVHLRSTTPLSVGNFSTTSTPRRYGTPPAVQRYDYKAR